MKSILFLLLLGFSIQSKAQSKWDQEPYLTKTFDNETIKNIESETSGGNIAVAGGSGAARVEVYVHGNNNNGRDDKLSKDEIQKRLNNYEY